MHNFSELFGILKALVPPLSFIPVCISLFRGQASQVTACKQSDAKSGSYIQYSLNSLNG